MSSWRLPLESILVVLALVIVSLVLLLPGRAAAWRLGTWNTDTQDFATFSRLSSEMLWDVAQATEPARPAPTPPVPQAPVPQPPAPLEPERPKPEKPREALLLERGAILLRQGNLVIEPSIDYAHFSSNRVAISGFTIFEAIIIGTIRVDRLDRDIVTGALTARYGLFDRLQLRTRIPYIYREDREVLGVGTADERERTINAHGLGDIEASMAWQALIGRRAWPDVILRVQNRVPTGKHPFEIGLERVGPAELRLKEPPLGSGFYGVGPGATFVWRSDPAVFFTGGGYTFNLSRDFGDRGKIDPGDTIEFFAGLNIALSERVSVNLSFSDQITGASTQDGRERAGTTLNDGRLTLGTSLGLRPDLSLLVSATAGLTAQSPDFQFSVSVPLTFKLF